MIITSELTMTKNGNEFIVSFNNVDKVIPVGTNTIVDNFYRVARSTGVSERATLYEGFTNVNGDFFGLGADTETPIPVPTVTNEEKVVRGLQGLMNFFTEFEFEPNFRFVNTLTYKANESKKSAKDYIANYFALMDNSYANEISAKLKSKEFGAILDDIISCGNPTKTVNNRFKIYYGSAGTGKTTIAQKETDNRCVVCNASMLPSDLMEDFVFVNGQPSFKPSSVWECMTNGLPIVLDEINLLPFDSLRFLQGILDGKSEFDYKGNKVQIKDGFQIIGTMNLTIGGMTYGLPEPLVDRASDMKKFNLTAEQLAKSILA